MSYDVTEVQKALKGAEYPLSGDDLGAIAEGNDADSDLVETLRKLEGSYDGPTDVQAALKGSLGD